MSKVASLKKPIFTGSIISKSETARAFAEANLGSANTDLLVSPVITKGQAAPEGHKRLTINLPIDLHRRLRVKALETDTTATNMIVKLLENSI